MKKIERESQRSQNKNTQRWLTLIPKLVPPQIKTSQTGFWHTGDWRKVSGQQIQAQEVLKQANNKFLQSWRDCQAETSANNWLARVVSVKPALISATVRPKSAPIEFPQEKREQIAQDLGKNSWRAKNSWRKWLRKVDPARKTKETRQTPKSLGS